MRRPLRIACHAVVTLALAGAIALGWAWNADRTRRWEPPSLTDRALVPLRAGQREDQGRQATWMVAVNLRCPRCLGTLRRLDAEWTLRARRERLVALIVDTSRRPDHTALRAVPPVPVWWDRDRIWRRRWGHRLYGEVIQFDHAGHYLRTVAAEEAMWSMRMPPDAPATVARGGTGP